MNNIILIGMPGCGKTTLARAAGEALGLPWYDCDALIEEKSGMSIADVFHTWGESAFRTMETAALIALCKHDRSVIATGGGCVTREENYGILHESGRLLWLRRDISLLSREGRPLSLSCDLNMMFAVRKPLYERLADLQIDNNGTIAETVQQIKKCYLDMGVNRL